MKVIGENEVKLQLKDSTGPMGPAGADGKDGTSVTHSWRGTTLTVTSASGTSSADLKGEKGEPGKDGKDGATGLVGPAGADGKDGQDGVSPTVTVEAIDGGHRVTITDANRMQSFDVMDGVDGKDGAAGSGSSVELDTTLTQSGKAADAKVVGDKLNELNQANEQQNEALAQLNQNIDKLNEGGLGYVTPEMFGATGDGVTNDLEAFKTALLQSLPIHLLDKHYKIDGDLFITVHNTCILGKTGGYSNTSPRLSFVNGHGLYINESIYNVRLNGFAIFSDGIGLTMQGENRPGNIVIEDIFFRCKRDVLIDTETGYIYFNKCHFNFNSDTEFDGDLVKIAYTGNGSNRANYIYFNQCAFEGSGIPNIKSSYLIHLDNCSNINFIQCDMCNCYNVIVFGTIGTSQYINLVNNYIWNCRTIANIASTWCFVMTGNSHYTPSGTQPLVLPNQRRGHVITGNIFPNWSAVSVENKGTIFANNYIGGTVSAEVLSKLHIGEYTY